MSLSKKLKAVFWYLPEFFFQRASISVVRCMSLKTAYRWADIISWFGFYLDIKHGHRAVQHVLHSGIRTDKKQARALARESFRHIVKVFVELVKFDQIVNKDNLYDYIRIADDPLSQKMLHQETTHQIILTTGHVGNWELAGGIYTVLTGIPMTSIMRPMSDRKTGEYIYRHRMSFQHTSVSKDKGLRPLLEAHKRGENITIVADQHANKYEGVKVMFFGHPARAHATPALLHLKTGTPLAMPYLIRLDDNFHFEYRCDYEEIHYKPTGDKLKDIQTICQLYTDVIEKVVRKYPEQWIWSHRRWLDCNRVVTPPSGSRKPLESD